MDVLSRMAGSGIVPVVVLDDAKDAVPTARALLAGGVDVMEITFRTAAARDSIEAVAKECPDMLVGAGTVVSLEQCKTAVEAGAKFIVAPGFNPAVVQWCVENNVAVTPGCVTPTEITAAMKLLFHQASVGLRSRPGDGAEGGQVLPRQRLRRSEGHEGPVRPLRVGEVYSHRRGQRGECGGVYRGPLRPGRGRQLGLRQERHRSGKF